MKSTAPPEKPRDYYPVYLDNDFALVPLQGRTKKPWEEDWQLRGIKTPEELARLTPGCNVGLILGEPSGRMIDADLDSPETRACTDLLPGTRCQIMRLGLGVTHNLYRLAEHRPDFCEWIGWSYGPARTREKLIELRYNNRQTMLPGSVHPDGDRPYWRDWPPPSPPTVTLQDLLVACRVVAAVAILKRAWPAKGTGSRDEFAYRVVGGLVYHQMPAEQALLIVSRAAQLAGDEEWGRRGDSAERAREKIAQGKKVSGFPTLEREFELPGFGAHLLDTLDISRQRPSVQGDGTGETPPRQQSPPRKSPQKRVVLRPWVPFPCEYLPPVMREMVEAVVCARNVDPALAALPAISAAAACAGAAFRVTPNTDWLEELAIWTMPVCESGTRKTPAFSAATTWLNAEQQRVIREHRQATREFERARRAGNDGAEPPEEPPVLLTSDGTIEAITLGLSSNIRGILYASEEAQGWFNSFTRYGGTSNQSYYLSLYGGAPIQQLRVSGNRAAARPVLNVSGAIQPGVLAEYLTAMNVLSGLLARVFLAMPPKRGNPYPRHPRNIHDALARWSALCAGLRALPWAELETETPHVIALSDLAVDHYEDWHNRLNDRLLDAPENDPAILADHKLWGNVLRLALIHHLCSSVAAGSDFRCAISRESVQAACALGDWFSNEQHRLYPYLMSGAASERQTLSDRILAYFVRHPDVPSATSRELLRALKGKDEELNADAVREALDALQNTGAGTCTVALVGGKTRVTFTPTTRQPQPASTDDED